MPLIIDYSDDGASGAIGLAAGLAAANQREIDRRAEMDDRKELMRFGDELTSRRAEREYRLRKNIDVETEARMEDDRVNRNKQRWAMMKPHILKFLDPNNPDHVVAMQVLDSGLVDPEKFLPQFQQTQFARTMDERRLSIYERNQLGVEADRRSDNRRQWFNAGVGAVRAVGGAIKGTIDAATGRMKAEAEAKRRESADAAAKESRDRDAIIEEIKIERASENPDEGRIRELTDQLRLLSPAKPVVHPQAGRSGPGAIVGPLLRDAMRGAKPDRDSIADAISRRFPQIASLDGEGLAAFDKIVSAAAEIGMGPDEVVNDPQFRRWLASIGQQRSSGRGPQP